MISTFFIRRPIFAAVVSIIITLVGVLAMKALPVAQYPNIIPPQVTVTAVYPGASADVIAKTVAAPIEQQINGVDDMIYMQSTSASSGSTTINVTFAIGTDPDQAAINVNNRVQRALVSLPVEARQVGVTVQKQSPAFLKVIALYSPDESVDTLVMSNYATLNMIDEYQRIPGVGSVVNFLDRDYSMRVWLNPRKLAKFALTTTDITRAIASQNAQFAPGQVGAEPMGKGNEITYTITAKGRLSSVDEFNNIILKTSSDGGILRLKDVARVELGAKNYNVVSTLNGKPALPIGIFLEPGANQIAVSEAVNKATERLASGFPKGVSYKVPYDTTTFVVKSIKEVIQTLLEALFLVFIVVLLFLQNMRATLIPMIAVPVSILGTFAGMYVFGFSINILTLFGLVLAIGIVVDDAIVVLENVERIMQEEKQSPMQAAILAMQEVTSPIIAIILVLFAVFVPVAFLGGIAGEMYKQFAMTISISVAISTVVALSLTPALCRVFLQPKSRRPLFLFRWFNSLFAWLTRMYLWAVRFFIIVWPLSLVLLVAIVIIIVGLFAKLPASLVPEEDQGYIIAVGALPEGAALQRTQVLGKQLDFISSQVHGIKDVFVVSGLDISSGFTRKTSSLLSFIGLDDWSLRQTPATASTAIAKTIGDNALQVVTDGFLISLNPPPIAGISSTGGFDVYLQNRKAAPLAELQAAAAKIIAIASEDEAIAPGLRTTFSMSTPQYSVVLDRDKASVLGVSVNDIFTTMKATFGTFYVNDITLHEHNYQVNVQADVPFRKNIASLDDIFVRSQTGNMIPLSTLIHVKKTVGPSILQRFNMFDAAYISGQPAKGYSSGQAIAAMKKAAKAAFPDDSFMLAWSGTAYQELTTTSSNIEILGFKITSTEQVFIIAIMMVFLILAALYERWLLPLAVLLAVPFALFGAALFTHLRGLENDIYFQVALVTLIGLAAKNAILIVEFAIIERDMGKSIKVAAINAAKLRFRPIVMTSLAFILGALPLYYSTGAGANSRHAIGTGIVGGMLAATFIATLVIPAFYYIIMHVGDFIARLLSSQNKLQMKDDND